MLDAKTYAPYALPADGRKMASSFELEPDKATLCAQVNMLVRGQPVTLEIFATTIFKLFEGLRGMGKEQMIVDIHSRMDS